MKQKKRVLIGSPIHQKPTILKQFLSSLEVITQDEIFVDFYFIDDNTNPDSSLLLKEFSDPNKYAILEKSQANQESYLCNDVTHYWSEELLWKVAQFKDRMIQKALECNYDYLFLIDSDIVIHPQTIDHLVKRKKDIVSNIFWTQWIPDTATLPQVWLHDFYTQYKINRGEHLTPEEEAKRSKQFLSLMKTPGIHEVGGLGACTLLSKHAMQRGLSFKEIKNITMWGEDRHFCIRAAALGLNLYVDTVYPAYHIYRESDLKGINEFKFNYRCPPSSLPPHESQMIRRRSKNFSNKLTLSMVVKNEADRHLPKVLEALKYVLDEAVIIDDHSDDHSILICEEILNNIPLHIIRNNQTRFTNEITLRKQQWEETIKTNPDWILNLDADEIFEENFNVEVRDLINQSDIDVFCFRLYDMWDDDHYRDDDYWRAHTVYRPFLVRYQESLKPSWKETSLHCGRFPENIFELPHALSNLRIKHYGWAQLEDRKSKYKRYIQQDPDGIYGWKEQYESILDVSPHLVRWED